MTKTSAIRLVLRAAAVLLTIAVIAALINAMRRDGPAALTAWRSADVKPAWIVVATLSGLLGHALFVVGWRRLLMDCGVNVEFMPAARMFLASNLGRYLPAGKAWQMSIIAVMAKEADLPAAILASTSLFQGALGVVVGAILLAITGGALLGIAPLWSVVPLAGVVALLLLPRALRRVPRLRHALVSKLPSLASVTGATMWTLVWTAGLTWFAWGLSLYALGMALLPNAVASPIAYTAAWIGSFIGGLVAIVAPAGLGVREELMRTTLTAAGLTSASALVVAVVSRVWTALLEIVPAAAVLAVRRSGARIRGARVTDA